MNNEIEPGENLVSEQLYSAANGGPAPVTRRRRNRVLLAVAAVVLFAGGAALGTALPDRKESTAYKSLAEEKSTIEIERDAALSSYASIEGQVRHP